MDAQPAAAEAVRACVANELGHACVAGFNAALHCVDLRLDGGNGSKNAIQGEKDHQCSNTHTLPHAHLVPVHLQQSGTGEDDANSIRRQDADQVPNESHCILRVAVKDLSLTSMIGIRTD